jgi:SAM-dependent methyltransferase
VGNEPFAAIAPFYDRLMHSVPYAEWVEYVELLVRHWRGRRERVLDLACGTGTVGLALAATGSRVVGVDHCREMLAVGTRKALEQAAPMAFVRQDLCRLALAPVFDLALCLFDSLNYLLDPAALAAAFTGTRAALARDGLFIFDLNTEFALESEMFTQEELEPDAPLRLRWQSAYHRATRTTRVNMEFFLDDGRVVTETHRQRAFTPREVREALAGAGFRTLAVYEAYTFDLPRRASDRVFYVCRPV